MAGGPFQVVRFVYGGRPRARRFLRRGPRIRHPSFAAPVVFFLAQRLNQFAISARRQGCRPLCRSCSATWYFGIEAVQVDGNDVLAVLAVTRYARSRAVMHLLAARAHGDLSRRAAHDIRLTRYRDAGKSPGGRSVINVGQLLRTLRHRGFKHRRCSPPLPGATASQGYTSVRGCLGTIRRTDGWREHNHRTHRHARRRRNFGIPDTKAAEQADHALSQGA
jgi:hypothetical protein